MVLHILKDFLFYCSFLVWYSVHCYLLDNYLFCLEVLAVLGKTQILPAMSITLFYSGNTHSMQTFDRPLLLFLTCVSAENWSKREGLNLV